MESEPGWRLLDTFDCYTPQYQFYFTHSEVHRWFRDAGLVEIAVLEPGISFIGTRPRQESASRSPASAAPAAFADSAAGAR